jgi:hypothetical protein
MLQYYDRSFHSPGSVVYGQQYRLNPQPLVAETISALPSPYVSFAPSVSHGDGSVLGDGNVEILLIRCSLLEPRQVCIC